ncbi:MAG: DEAD/DEAH box helicase [Patescibacteria group bacterium]
MQTSHSSGGFKKPFRPSSSFRNRTERGGSSHSSPASAGQGSSTGAARPSSPSKFGGPSRFGGSHSGPSRFGGSSSSSRFGSSSRPSSPSRFGGTSSAPSRFGSRSGAPSRFGSSSSAPSRFGGSRGSSAGSSSRFGGGSRFGGNRGGNRGGGNRGKTDNIHFSKFINKAVVTEVVENYIPEHKFADFQIDQTLKDAILAKGYSLPTPIQDKSIPHILRGSDIVGIANTGTGKTGAFLIPLINKVKLDPKQHILILVPTRELAIQIDQELKGFTKGSRIYSVCCVGGMSIHQQMMELRHPNNFIIGTPGRVKDLIQRGRINLASFKTVVLDEADRMLDMGFINDMREVMAGMPKDRHTLFFSATLSSDIEKLIGEFLKQPVRVSVKTRDTSKNIDQDIVRIERGSDKVDVLHKLLSNPEFNKVIIFGRTKHGVEKLSKLLVQKGFKAEAIHGNKTHGSRQKALTAFKNNYSKILVATDVAARGLDIPDVSHVINYDIPATYDDYVHRIGRTGRNNKKGIALTFVE